MIDRRNLIRAALALPVAAAAGAVGFALNQGQDTSPAGHAQAQSAAVEVFGVVRFPAGGPQILDDTGHTPQGLTSVTIDANGFLQINHTDLQVVGFSSVTVDETLAARGIIAGGSQGFDAVRIKFRDTDSQLALNLNNSTHYSKLGGTNANIWFYARSAN